MKLAVRQVGRGVADPGPAPGQVEHEPPDAQLAAILGCLAAAQGHAGSCQQLVEREGLGHVVDGAELESAQLGLQVPARREHDHGQVGHVVVHLTEDLEPAAAG